MGYDFLKSIVEAEMLITDRRILTDEIDNDELD